MIEIGARIMPYPAPQEHPADKEGSPTVSARFNCRHMSFSLDFFWIPSLRENSSLPFPWNEGLLIAVVERTGEGGGPDA
jgi:hypothetical protein